MKKNLVFATLIVMMLAFTGNAMAIYVVPGDTLPTQEDIAVAEKALTSLQWDYSKYKTENKIFLKMPKVEDKYSYIVKKDTGKYVGLGLYRKQVYDGHGEDLLELTASNPKGIGIYIMFVNNESTRVISDETYIYYPNQTVFYIPPDDRISASIDENYNINQYYNNELKQISKIDSRVTEQFKTKYPIFTDFDGSYWAYKVIYELSSRGYIKGYPDGTFNPDNNIKRAEFSAMMGNLLKDRYPDGSVSNNEGLFTDYTHSHWAYSISNTMFGYMTRDNAFGVFGNTFSPEQKITRGEVVAAIHAILKNNPKFTDYLPRNISFADINKSKFNDSMAFCASQGFIAGYPDGTFRPDNEITRAEIAAVLVRIIKSL